MNSLLVGCSYCASPFDSCYLARTCVLDKGSPNLYCVSHHSTVLCDILVFTDVEIELLFHIECLDKITSVIVVVLKLQIKLVDCGFCSDDYFRMKLQWKSMSADQESRFSELRDRKSLIGILNT